MWATKIRTKATVLLCESRPTCWTILYTLIHVVPQRKGLCACLRWGEIRLNYWMLMVAHVTSGFLVPFCHVCIIKNIFPSLWFELKKKKIVALCHVSKYVVGRTSLHFLAYFSTKKEGEEEPESHWFGSRYIGPALGRGMYHFMLLYGWIYSGHYSWQGEPPCCVKSRST